MWYQSQGRFYLNFKQMDTEYVVDVRFFYYYFRYEDGQSLNQILFLTFLIRIRTQVIS